MLFTDGTKQATDEEVAAEHRARTIGAASEAKRQAVSDFIDGKAVERVTPVAVNLAAEKANGLAVEKDSKDGSYVVLTLPTDAGAPKYWDGVLARLLKFNGAEMVGTRKIRIDGGAAIKTLAEVDGELA